MTTQCKGTTSSNKRCTRQVKNGEFCFNHKQQENDDSEDEAEEDPEQLYPNVSPENRKYFKTADPM